MEKLLRIIGATLFISALAALLILLVSDASNHLQYTLLHRKAGAWSFMLVGLSYIALQLRIKQPAGEAVKHLLLGMGFAFWGGEQFLPEGMLATAMDTAVVVIFVVDLSLVIIQHLGRRVPAGSAR